MEKVRNPDEQRDLETKQKKLSKEKQRTAFIYGEK